MNLGLIHTITWDMALHIRHTRIDNTHAVPQNHRKHAITIHRKSVPLNAIIKPLHECHGPKEKILRIAIYIRGKDDTEYNMIVGIWVDIYSVRVAQWIRRPPTKREIAGSSHIVDYPFYICFHEISSTWIYISILHNVHHTCTFAFWWRFALHSWLSLIFHLFD